jgi:hypothetical protein
MTVLRRWRRICLSKVTWLQSIELLEKYGFRWVSFARYDPEGASPPVLLPLDRIGQLADLLDELAVDDCRNLVTIERPITGMDGWDGLGGLVSGSNVRYWRRRRPGLRFRDGQGTWSILLHNPRQARLLARLFRMMQARYGLS